MHRVWLLTIALLVQALAGPAGASTPFAEERARCPQMAQFEDCATHDCCTETGCAAEAGCITSCQGNAGTALPSIARAQMVLAVERHKFFRKTGPALAAHSPPLNRPPIAL